MNYLTSVFENGLMLLSWILAAVQFLAAAHAYPEPMWAKYGLRACCNVCCAIAVTAMYFG